MTALRKRCPSAEGPGEPGVSPGLFQSPPTYGGLIGGSDDDSPKSGGLQGVGYGKDTLLHSVLN
jgi:hypothetical protein